MQAKILAFFKKHRPGIEFKKRFVGEEPLDPITNQYNHALLEVLPKNGIDLIVIPRKPSSDGNPISASRVRDFLENRDFGKIYLLVPKTTLGYLMEKYGCSTAGH